MRLTLPWNTTADAGSDSPLGQRSSMLEYDQALVWVVLLLLLTGVVMVYSASIGLPDSPKYANYKNHHFLMRHHRIDCGLVCFPRKNRTMAKCGAFVVHVGAGVDDFGVNPWCG